jgi:hypothetical protein
MAVRCTAIIHRKFGKAVYQRAIYSWFVANDQVTAGALLGPGPEGNLF